ncbi:MAG: hypothetical protein QHH24_02785 [Candidatus Bathyarchaeota archaeon]|nr:hypothetical protein [Candidatus Bathyarchaeota archaeon]
MTEQDFEKLLLEAIDEALATLGESAKQSIYFHIQKEFKVPRNQIPSRMESFKAGLEKIFGIGAQYLELMIMRKLYEKTGKPLKWSQKQEFAFVEYINAAKKTFVRNKVEVART